MPRWVSDNKLFSRFISDMGGPVSFPDKAKSIRPAVSAPSAVANAIRVLQSAADYPCTR